MATILVTGALGFLGANFVYHMMEATDYNVIALDKVGYASCSESLNGCPQDRLRLVVGDICNPGVLDEVMSGVDAIAHFAAESHNDNAITDPSEFIRSNLLGTYQVLEAARRHDVAMHHVSTDEVYGDTELDDRSLFTERSPYRPSSPYAATKAGSDHLVRAWVRTYGIAATISNCSNNYGPRQHVEKFIPRQITSLLDGSRPRVYGSGRNIRDWIHVDDHSAAVRLILERGRVGDTYLISSTNERSNLEVVRELLAIFEWEEHEFDWVTDRRGHDQRYALDSTKIRAELGWQPRRTDFGLELRRTVAWYRNHEEWWRASKGATEAAYANTGQ